MAGTAEHSLLRCKGCHQQLEDGSYRILVSSSGKISYTDDFGKTWSTASTSDSLSSTIWMCVDEKNPQYVYAYGYYYNQYYFYSKPKADITDARYILMVSDDYGKTFKDAQTICQYDECDNAYRIAYLDEGTFAIAAGYYGAYLVTDYGKTITKMDNVSYCKTMGYGAAQKEGDPYTLYMYGKRQILTRRHLSLYRLRQDLGTHQPESPVRRHRQR